MLLRPASWDDATLEEILHPEGLVCTVCDVRLTPEEQLTERGKCLEHDQLLSAVYGLCAA